MNIIITIVIILLILSIVYNIINLKKIAKLKFEHKNFKTFLQSVPAISCAINTDGSFIFIEGKIEEITGYSKEDLINGNIKFEDMVLNEDKHIFFEIADKLMNEPNSSFQYTFRIKRKDGKIRWLQRVAENVTDENGNVLYSHGITYDVSKLKQTELKIQKLYFLNDLILNSIKEGIIGVNKEGKIQFINNSAIKLLRLESFHVIGKNIHDIIHTKNIKKENCQILKTIQEGKTLTFRNDHFCTATGERIEIELNITPIVTGGKILGAVLSFSSIAERRAFEEELLKLLNVINQAEVSIVITDVDAKIIYTNKAFEDITGYKFGEVFGENPRILKSGLHDEKFYKELWDTISSGKTWKGRLINKRKDGTLYYEDAIIFPLKDLDNNIVNYAGIKKDITKEVELEEQLKLTQKLEAMGQIVGGVAHDFNNILTVISGYAELMQMQITDGSPLIKPIKEIFHSVERAKALINQLLIFSRKKVITPTKLNLNNILKEAQKMLRRLIPEDIQLKINLSDKELNIWADQTQIEQIIINLVVNARDAIIEKKTPSNKEIKISIEYEKITSSKRIFGFKVKKGDYGKIIVEDTGIGIDRKIIKKIFEPFFTTKESSKGTGLGLATVYGIVTQHKGFIDVKTTKNNGSTFYIYLPLYDETKEKSKKNNINNKIEFQQTKKFTETILLIEDNTTLLNIIENNLKEIGYNVLKAKDGEKGLEIYEKNRNKIKLIISDIVMPKLDGYQLYEKLKNDDIKIIFITGYTDRNFSDIEKNKNIKLIYKPFKTSELNQAIRELLS